MPIHDAILLALQILATLALGSVVMAVIVSLAIVVVDVAMHA